jgi:putative SOS response-associated peptidase YedK
MEPYHDRMPVLLKPKDFDAWLNGSLGALPRPNPRSANGRSRPGVNRSGEGDDDPTIIEPLATTGDGLLTEEAASSS